jgi:hypothetical protein
MEHGGQVGVLAMMRSLAFLSCVGAALYALLVVTAEMLPVIPDGTRAEFVSRQTRLSAWGPYLPDRSLHQKPLEAAKELASRQQKVASRGNSPVAGPVLQTVTSSGQDERDDQIGKRLVSVESTVDDEAIWFVVSRAARLHAGPSVSSPIVHLYPVGTELKLIGYEQGWLHVLEPGTSRTGWIYERYYLDAIPGPGQTRLMVQESTPKRIALMVAQPKPVKRVKQQKPRQKSAKPPREQRIRLASARSQDESVASIMERAFRRN